MIWYLITYVPFEEPLMQKLDIFNEFTTLALMYTVLCFSRANILVGEYEMPYDIAFMCFLCGNMATHLFFLIRDTCIESREKCKKGKCCKCCKKNSALKYEETVEAKRDRFATEQKLKTVALEIVNEQSHEEYDSEEEEEEE